MNLTVTELALDLIKTTHKSLLYVVYLAKSIAMELAMVLEGTTHRFLLRVAIDTKWIAISLVLDRR